MGVFQWCNHDRDWHAFCCEHRDLQIATEFWQETSPKLHIGDSHEFEAGMTSVSVACIYISSLPALPTRLELGGWGAFQWCNHDRDWHSFCCEHRDLQIATEFWQETSPKLHLYTPLKRCFS